VRDDGIDMNAQFRKRRRGEARRALSLTAQRVEEFGGRLSVWSKVGAGTEIEMTIDGALAYKRSPAGDIFVPS